MKQYRGNRNYRSNQGVLTEDAFVILPYGAVQPKEWLKHQLLLQKYGMLGSMEEQRSLYGPNNGWLGGDGESWEKGPYYLRGLIALAYTLDDEALKAKAQKWIESILSMQRANGFFGPHCDGDGEGGFDWWPRMVVIQLLRDYYEATAYLGHADERVVTFLESYFRFQQERLDGSDVGYWASLRGADNIDIILWLYNHLFQPDHPEANDWMIELADRLRRRMFPWTDIFTSTAVREHVVNIEQGMKYPAVCYQLTRSDLDRKAFLLGIESIRRTQGRIDGLPNADEFSRDNKPYHGTELCAVVEGLLSSEISLRILGDAWIGDRMEKLAYNALPTLTAPDQTGHAYFTAQNQAMLIHGYHGAIHDQGDNFTFASPSGCECCFPNNGMGYSKFIQTMWMATADNGLAAIAYGPNRVCAHVAEGKVAVFDQITRYPFGETIELCYEGEVALFPLKLRLPEWCVQPSLELNGLMKEIKTENGYAVIERTWKPGDMLRLHLPMQLRTSSWYNDMMGVELGPLIFSLKIKEVYSKITDNDARHCDIPATEELPLHEVTMGARWNYGLLVNNNGLEHCEISRTDQIPLQPFFSDNAPIVIRTKGQQIPDWMLMNNSIPELPFGCVEQSELPVEEVELIPYACTRLKVALFPKIGQPNGIVRQVKNVLWANGEKTARFTDIVVPYSWHFALKLRYNGAGWLRLKINERIQMELPLLAGQHERTLRALTDQGREEWFRFDQKIYNTLELIYPQELEILEFEIIPQETWTPRIERVTRKPGCAVLATNILREIGFYEVEYGCESGCYTKRARGFDSRSAILSGLDDTATYYFTLVMRKDGKITRSEEYVSPPAAESTEDLIQEVHGAFESAIIKYIREPLATTYKIAYGIEPGVYTDEIYNIAYNPYIVEGLRADKIVLPSLENGQKYYLRMCALHDGAVIRTSNEWSCIPGDLPETNGKVQLQTALAFAHQESRKAELPLLSQAIEEAEWTLAHVQANQMAYDIAIRNLRIALGEETQNSIRR